MSLTEARQKLDGMWEALEKPVATTSDAPGILWDLAMTPALPMAWPPASSMAWVQYAYAYGRDSQIADGVPLAKPWATITLHAGGSATLTQLTPALEEDGVQGMVPVGQEQRAALQTGEAAQATALKLTSLPDASSPQARELKTYYSAWVKFNGAIARLVRPNHAAFFRWLEQ